MHSTRKLDDGYLGSGKVLRRSLYKHGRENHKIEILEFFENREDLTKAETLLITEDVLKDFLCMNLKCGGIGGLPNFSNKEKRNFHSLGGKSTINKNGKIHLIKLKEDEDYRQKYLKTLSESISGDKNGFYNKKHNDESKLKMSNSHKNKHNGELNSQFGTVWITNGTENKKIKKESLIPDGWKRGRNMVM